MYMSVVAHLKKFMFEPIRRQEFGILRITKNLKKHYYTVFENSAPEFGQIRLSE